MLTRLLLPTLLLLAACNDADAPKLLRRGAQAPELVGETADGTWVKLSDLRGKTAVVYFYPKDDTPGCTKEACAFRDWYEKYQDADVEIFGVSGDDADSHREFRKKYELPFPLVADVDGKVAAAYGVSATFGIPARVTFLVNEEGKIAKVFKNVDPGVHAEEVLAFIQKP